MTPPRLPRRVPPRRRRADGNPPPVYRLPALPTSRTSDPMPDGWRYGLIPTTT